MDKKDFRILVVDDERELGLVVVELLLLTGYTAEYLESGKQALEKLKKETYHLFILDISMPGISGLRLLQELDVPKRAYCAFMLTGLDDLEFARKAMELGAFSYLLKPFQSQDLLLLVGKAQELVELKISKERHVLHLQEMVGARTEQLEKEIGERRRSEAALQESEGKYRILVENINSGVFLSTFSGTFLHLNHYVARTMGYESVDELMQKPASCLYADQADREHLKEVLIRDGEARNIELRCLKKDGTQVWVSMNAVLLRGKAGNPDRILGMVQDITERKQAEKALRRSEWLSSKLFKLSPAATILSRAADGMCMDVNDAYARLVGFTREELIGHTTTKLNIWASPEERNRVVVELQHRGRLENVPLTLRKKDGTFCSTEASGEIVDIEGTPYILSFFFDVTDRKRAEEEAIRQRDALSHVTRVATMSELATSLAHEINQPLAAILSNAQAALRFMDVAKPDLAEIREALKDIVADDQRAGTIIREIRALMKKEEPRRESLDIAMVIGEVLVLTRGDSVIKGIRVKREVPAGLPHVSGSRVQLQQVFINLINNGFEAMKDSGYGDRILTLRAFAPDDRTVAVEVVDCGHGLQEGVAQKIFEPFFTTGHNGLGLGLTIARSIIESHGGKLSARNNSGKGATFSVILPVKRDES